MPDQATDLRQLVRQCAAPAAPAAGARPRRIVVCGGKGGVGTTTVAVNLAAALARQAEPTLLIDAAGGDATILCGLDPLDAPADARLGFRPAADVLQPGPCGLQVLPGGREMPRTSEDVAAALDRLLTRWAAGGEPLGAAVLDAGNRPERASRRLWQTADVILMVTTPEPPAVLATFASIRTLAQPAPAMSLSLLVNRAKDSGVAEDVYHRLARACRRFLAIRLDDAGWVPADAAMASFPPPAEPDGYVALEGPASRCFGRLARWVSGRSAEGTEDNPYQNPEETAKPGRTIQFVPGRGRYK